MYKDATQIAGKIGMMSRTLDKFRAHLEYLQ